MHGFSVYVVYNISYLQIVVLGILFSSSKMGSKNLEVDLGASSVEVHEMISNLKYCHTDLSPLF